MSSFALEAAEEGRTIEYKYRGLVFEMDASPNIRNWRKVLLEQVTEAGHDSDLMNKAPEDGGADKETVTAWLGRAMASTFIKDVYMHDADGNKAPLVIKDQAFDFNAPSSMDYFETQGEELIGSNPIMQNTLFIKAESLVANPDRYENIALGK